ncbi:MAG: hypothetical protein C0594_08025 [Marinilabiliales bacterium]|nr:MAG: hypothetical protein C0594_08025 [Marinilabiliales bacterium]
MAEQTYLQKAKNMLESLSADERISLAQAIRQDANLLNAINGVLGPNDSLAPHGSITGTVDDGSDPLENVKVIATNGDETYVATTTSDGTYQLDVPAGTYSLLFAIASYDVAAEASVEVTSGATTSETDKSLTADV